MPRLSLLQQLTFAALSLTLSGAGAQVVTAARPAVRVTVKVDNASTVALPGTHPVIADHAKLGHRLAATTPLQSLHLVLNPSDDQVYALHSLLEQQQDKTSANYHKWLTPDTFGQYFGVAPADLAQVTAWLQDQGFTVGKISKSNRIVEFSGTVGQVETAFHTQMSTLTVNGEEHIANTTDIAIPAALAPVIKGIASLNNFFPKSDVVNPHKGELTTNIPANNYVTANATPLYTSTSSGAHYVTPGDVATIYNSTPLLSAGIDGTGQTIAVIGRTNITLSDVQQFRSMFGLKKNDPTFTVIGNDPGINTDDIEAYLDVEWAGGVAPGASINFIVGGSDYEATSGISTAGLYAVDNNIGDIITLSYGGCETSNGASGTAFFNTMWEQAAAQGQTVFVSSGDSSAAGCQSSSASYGTAYGVNALGSSDYNVAVGGSMFVDYGPSMYWGPGVAAPAPAGYTFATATSYIPEATWNEGSLSTTYLNTLSTAAQGGSGIVGGGGGVSIYSARPSWQTGSGISATADSTPVSGTGIAAGSPITGLHRLVPDIAFIAASGHDATAFCAEGVCSDTSTGYGIGAVGGTSVATPVMASVQALINQRNGGRQGNANFFFYPLANADYAAGNCKSVNGTAANPTVTLPAATCNFHDIVAGSNVVKQNSTDTTGLGFLSATGFDSASGLGSVNITNVATNWSTVSFRASKTAFTLTPTITAHGTAQAFSATVTAASGTGTPTGDISIIAETTIAGVMQRYTLTAGAYSGNINGLSGGSYNIHVHYAGDGTFAPSDSASVPVQIGKENSAVAATVQYFKPGTVTTLATVIPYGSLLDLIATATAASGAGTPSGTMTLSVAKNGTALTPYTGTVDSVGDVNLIAGAAYTSLYLAPNYPSLTPGAYTVGINYSGDASFNTSNATVSFTVSQLTPTGTFSSSSSYINSAAPVTLNYSVAQVTASYFPTLAAFPSGMVTFTDTTSGTVLGTANLNAAGIASFVTTGITTTGANTISATYSGDANYASITSTGSVTVGTLTPTSTALTVSSGTYYVGSTVLLTATVSPAASATVRFYDSGVLLGSATSSATTGLAQLNFSNFTAGTHSLSAIFAGTSTYASSAGTLSQSISQNLTTVTIDAPMASIYGQAVVLNGRVGRSPTTSAVPAVPLTGTVTFYDGSTAVGSATPVFLPGGYAYYTATLTLPALLTGGSHTLSATYNGDANYATASSSTVTTTVAPVTPSIIVSSTSTVYTPGSPVSLAITIPAAASQAVPTGTVTLLNTISTATYGTTLTYSAAAGGFVGTVTLAGLSGTQTFTASLAADTNYAAATSAPFTITVVTNNVWVANGNSTVSALTSTGTAKVSGVAGGGIGVAIDNAGNVWSLSSSSNAVAKYPLSGAAPAMYTGGGLNSPSALAIDGNGYVWITNNGNSTLSVFNAAGTPVSATAYSPAIGNPHSITIDSTGSLWITNYADSSLTQVIGVAAPVVTPATTAVKNNTVAVKP